jgi:CBS domain containing-hemolysin-like protein
MMLGMSFATFTTVHVIISLIAIFAGFIVLFGMFKAEKLSNWTALFLVTAVLTSVTGFFFPFGDLLPSHIVGIVSLAVLAVAILALYICHLARSWRWIYVTGAVTALQPGMNSSNGTELMTDPSP